MSINKSFISGHVGKKPELKKTNSGRSWVKFSVATTEEWRDKTTGEKKEHTDWHQVKAWGKLAEAIAQWVVVGQYLEIIGKHKCDMVEKENAPTQYYDYIQIEEVVFGPKPQSYWKDYEAKKAAGLLPQKQTQNNTPPALTEIVNTLNTLSVAVAQLMNGNTAQPPAPPANAGMPQHLSADESDYGQPYEPPTPTAAPPQIANGL
jgi:single-strand DNA-binding protein